MSKKKSIYFSNNISGRSSSENKDRHAPQRGRSTFLYRMEVQVTHFLKVPYEIPEKKIWQSDSPAYLVEKFHHYCSMYPKHTIVAKGPFKN
jgi:hypothetical protein